MRLPENHWYPVLETSELGRKPLGALRLGRKFVFFRGAGGDLHAHADRCPHLGASLSGGTIEHGCLVCPFHGFRYDAEGVCRHIPAVGRDGKIPPGMVVQSFPVREAHGFIWLWWGAADRVARSLPFFSALEAKDWCSHTIVEDWPVHYTRAIENQLDVAHLPFVHRTTIGRGGRTVVDGPYVEADEAGIRVWVSNRPDEGQPKSIAELAYAAKGKNPSLHLLFPGVWLLEISATFKNFIAFVPINEQTTRYYLRSYRRFGVPLIGGFVDWLFGVSNRFILNQDRRVVVPQTPASSLDAADDVMIGADRAISVYRKWHEHQLTQTSTTAR